ncbi:hypothetical protein HK104_006665 [Borealophlyctis nickersoniae]|nr:hypothetical protein HK104_006665 [Borealophlyctis nickersoniae]
MIRDVLAEHDRNPDKGEETSAPNAMELFGGGLEQFEDEDEFQLSDAASRLEFPDSLNISQPSDNSEAKQDHDTGSDHDTSILVKQAVHRPPVLAFPSTAGIAEERKRRRSSMGSNVLADVMQRPAGVTSRRRTLRGGCAVADTDQASFHWKGSHKKRAATPFKQKNTGPDAVQVPTPEVARPRDSIAPCFDNLRDPPLNSPFPSCAASQSPAQSPYVQGLVSRYAIVLTTDSSTKMEKTLLLFLEMKTTLSGLNIMDDLQRDGLSDMRLNGGGGNGVPLHHSGGGVGLDTMLSQSLGRPTDKVALAAEAAAGSSPVEHQLRGQRHGEGDEEDGESVSGSQSGDDTEEEVSAKETTHECKWTGCNKVFDTCAELVHHVSEVHIGNNWLTQVAFAE